MFVSYSNGLMNGIAQALQEKKMTITKGQKMNTFDRLEKLIEEVIHIADELRNSSPKTKAIAIAGIIVAAFTPSYIGIALWLLMSPEGFWQVFALVAALILLLGTTQLGCLIICAIGIIKLLIGKKAVPCGRKWRW